MEGSGASGNEEEAAEDGEGTLNPRDICIMLITKTSCCLLCIGFFFLYSGSIRLTTERRERDKDTSEEQLTCTNTISLFGTIMCAWHVFAENKSVLSTVKS